MSEVTDFANRAARIAAKARDPKAMKARAAEDAALRQGLLGPTAQQRSAHRRGVPLRLHPAATTFGFLLGIMGVGAGQVLRFRMGGQPTTPESADIDLLMGLGYGFGLTFVMTLALGMVSLRQIAVQGAGVIAMSCLFHNIYHWYPLQAAMAFSPSYVLQMQAGTTANTLRLPEMELAFGPASTPGAAPDPRDLAMAALQMLTGDRRPTEADRARAEALAMAVLSGDMAALNAQHLAADQTPGLDLALLTALEKDRAKRNAGAAIPKCPQGKPGKRNPSRLVMQSDKANTTLMGKVRRMQTESILGDAPKGLAGAGGLEPATLGFGDRCSTN